MTRGDNIKNHSTALTLVESLVVLAIILILAALVGLSIPGAVKGAKKTASLSNLSQIGTATLIYASNYDQLMPPWLTSDAIGTASLSSGPAAKWRDSLLPYAKSKDIFFSPMDPYAGKPQNPADIPDGSTRGITSYIHDSRLNKYKINGIFQLAVENLPEPSNNWLMYESGIAYVRVPSTSMQYELPMAEDSTGVLFADMHAKRIPWHLPTK